ncbi:MAG: aminotransferase class I/II-fold pyridoxal phosphate-dependent enzyme, partial [Planctomycetota bacterium]
QPHIKAYHKKRDMIVEGLSDLYEIANPNGAFYVFPKAPWGTGTEFVKKAIEHNLLIIPGNVFSRDDTHFRISYAASDEVIAQGIRVLRDLARG